MHKNMDPALTAPLGGVRLWMSKAAEPTTIIATLAIVGTCANWWESRSADSVHLEDRVHVLEVRADDVGAVQRATVELANKFASLGTRLDSFYDLLKVIRDDQQHQDDVINRRLDYLQQQSGRQR